MKPLRGFLGFLAFIGLAWLAINPYLTVEIQNRFTSEGKAEIETPIAETPQTPKSKARALPITQTPDAEGLPRLKNFKSIAKSDIWIGDTPCGEDIFDAPLNLPLLGPRRDGPLLTEPITTGAGSDILNQPTFLFNRKNGVTLKLVQPVIEYYPVKGRRFKDAQKYIFDREPLKSLRQSGETAAENKRTQTGTRATIAADILSPSSIHFGITGSLGRYRLDVRDTVLTSAYLVRLPKWKNYADASLAEKSKWDDFLCNISHHELGHLRIRLDILAETLDSYAALPPAHSFEEMKSLTIEHRKDISERINKRQDIYHIYNDGGIRRGMTERPYAELPFPWLAENPSELKTVEQSPE